MKVGIVVNTMESRDPGTTTYRIAAACSRMGHEVWITSTGGFSCDTHNRIQALTLIIPARSGPVPRESPDLKRPGDNAACRLFVDELDVLLLRSNPSVQNAWAQYAGIDFGQMAARAGVIVLNDPAGLRKALDKSYLQTFPESIRPRTLISRSEEEIREFAAREGTVVLKPLQGSGGKGVFVVPPQQRGNLGEMIRAVSRDGYVIAQEYLPAAAEGDTRLFLMNGVPLQYKGKYAAFRRVRSGDDVRSNIHAGGKLRRAVVDDTMLRIAETVRPRLIADGMFLVGLDIVGDKLMEINVFTPGGLGSAQRFEKVDFTRAVIHALERKVRYLRYYGRMANSQKMVTL